MESRLAFGLGILLLFASVAIASVKPPMCGDMCQPDPTSSDYAPIARSKPLSHNNRGGSSVFAPKSKLVQSQVAGDGVTMGSQSYNYAIPIVHLPGRAGLDLDLTLYYNSSVWTIDQTNRTATFNADRDFPSYGFRLGFGYLEGPMTNSVGTTSYILTEPDGTKRELRSSSSNVFLSLTCSPKSAHSRV